MKKLFRNKLNENEQRTTFLAVPTTEETYWETIKEQDVLGWKPVIFVTDMQEFVMNEVVQKGGKVIDVELQLTRVEEKDSFYNPPQPFWLWRLFGKKVDPSIEAEHHKEYHESLLQRHNYELRVQERIRKMIPLFNSSTNELNSDFNLFSWTVRENGVELSNLTVELNGKTMKSFVNGVFVTESEELEEIIIESASHYFNDWED